MWPFCQKAEAVEARVAIAIADRDLIYANFYFSLKIEGVSREERDFVMWGFTLTDVNFDDS